ncbi:MULTISPECIES: head GIN domain-containing protein [Siphonobacter]|uniref:DUF2807 domain-containing protein n=1 Tax=Siphonobacter curvatus TaxID=2094562 RepID=A0A2S7IPJ5_9BACT|nr:MULTISPECIES: head GIN domain-containing protein [Siphonobacter]PMD99228.1 hypothetical protein BWI97_02140 [Siphonobacter sp. BAB-5405]PQA59631.1 DUF2807 domain-containing protein [Siphonobacter curvatus]
MKHLPLLVLGLLASYSGYAQQTKTVDLKSFSKVRILGCVTAELKKANDVSLKITTPGTLEESKITVETKNDELIIRQKWEKEVFQKGDCRASNIRLELGYKEVESIYSGVGAEITVIDPIQTRDLDLQAATGSQIRLEADVRNLKAKAVQGAVLDLSGTASEQQVTVNTGGEVHAFNLTSEDAFVKANTGGVARITTTKRLDANAGTGGAVRYKGNPAKKNINSSLGGEVKAE